MGFSRAGCFMILAVKNTIESDLPLPCVCQMTPIFRSPSSAVALTLFDDFSSVGFKQNEIIIEQFRDFFFVCGDILAKSIERSFITRGILDFKHCYW